MQNGADLPIWLIVRHSRLSRGHSATPHGQTCEPQCQVPTCALALQDNSGDPKTALGHGVDMLKGGGGIFKSAAVTVLRQDRQLLTTAEITK